MNDPAKDYMREAFLGLEEGGVDVAALTDDEWRMFRSDMDAEIRRAARGWAIAALALRETSTQETSMRERKP